MVSNPKFGRLRQTSTYLCLATKISPYYFLLRTCLYISLLPLGIVHYHVTQYHVVVMSTCPRVTMMEGLVNSQTPRFLIYRIGIAIPTPEGQYEDNICNALHLEYCSI